MSLVAQVEPAQAPLLARPHFAGGDPGPLVATLAHVPEVLEVALPFIGTVLGPSAVALRTKEIVILRASARMGCRYCTDSHTVVARDSGLSVPEVAALRGEAPMGGAFPEPGEAALVAWTDAVAGGPGAPPESAGRDLARHFGEAEIVELTLLAGATLMLNRFATALGLPTSASTAARLADEGWRCGP